MVYMISAHYAADPDSPARTDGMANNVAAFRSRVDGAGGRDGFVWNRHDAGRSLGTSGDSRATDVADCYLWGTRGKNHGTDLSNFNPAELHYELCTGSAEYRMKFADLVYRHCVREGGAMTAPVAEARFRARMAEIDDAVVCEAARWGRSGQTYSTWLNSGCAGRLAFISQRTPYLIQGYRNLGWYPSVDAPTAVGSDGLELTNGTTVAAADVAYLRTTSGGTVYYTTDGSDPRLEGGAVSASASVFAGEAPGVTTRSVPLFAKGASWLYYDWGRQPGNDADGNTWKAESYDDANLSGDANAWATGAAPLGFKSGTAFATPLSRYVNHAASGTQVMTFYFRKTFTLPADVDPASIVSLSGVAWYDDGYVMYVNGVEIGRGNIGAGYTITYDIGTNDTGTDYVDPGDRAFTFKVPAGVLHAGENTIAVEVHQCHGTSTDAAWDLSLEYNYTVSGTGRDGIEVPATGMTLKARVRSATGVWSALEDVTLLGSSPSGATEIRVAEVMSVSADEDGDGREFIVLTNLNAEASFDLSGVRVTSEKTDSGKLSLDLALPAGLSLAPGGTLQLDRATYWPDEKITNGAVDMYLYDTYGNLVQTLHFESAWWDKACNGTGAHFIALDFAESVTTEEQWRPSFVPPSKKAGKNAVTEAVAADDRIRTWLDAIGATESGQASIDAFKDDAKTVVEAYLVGLDALADPEAEIFFLDIEVDDDGRVRLTSRSWASAGGAG